MSPAATVLVIEDDDNLRAALEMTLRRAGLVPLARPDGRTGLRALHQRHPDAVVLDIGLPDLDGWTVLERIRDLSDVPVLLLTARNLEMDKVRGLQAGADDYLTKPFGNAELVARVRALVRRASSTADVESVLVHEETGLTVDVAAREVTIGDEPIPLTPLEYRVLHALMRQQGRVLSPTELLEEAWDDPVGVSPDRVKFAVMRLRAKLGPAGSSIQNRRGFGYRIT